MLRIAADAQLEAFGQAQDAVIGIDLNDTRVRRPVLQTVLGKRAERAQPGTECENHVGLRDRFHRGLRTLISKRADGELVVVRKRIVVQIRRCDGSAEEFGKFARLRERVACNDAAAGKDHRIPCVGERFGGGRDLSGVSGAAFERQRRIDFGEEVA